MNKFASILLAAATTLGVASCNNNANKTQSDGDEYGDSYTMTTADSLRQALADQDSLLSLMNDISADMNRIKSMENILATGNTLATESTSRRESIKNDIQAIQLTLEQRRQRLEELEKKLRHANANNATLQKSIETLKSQIAEQEGTIATLREELAKANIFIEELTGKVDTLTSTLASVNEAKEQAEEESVKLADQLNTCYYAIGSRKELKQQDIIETGFLRKTIIMPSDFNANFFRAGDKRTLSTIDLHSKKAKVLTNQPADSYSIEDVNGEKVLKITNAARFWEKSNYLVIQID